MDVKILATDPAANKKMVTADSCPVCPFLRLAHTYEGLLCARKQVKTVGRRSYLDQLSHYHHRNVRSLTRPEKFRRNQP